MLFAPLMCAKKRKTKMSDPISLLESCWQGRQTKEIKSAFAELKRNLKKETPFAKARAAAPAAPSKSFNILDIVRRTCAAHDFLFLSRQITYHISASADLKRVAGDEGQIEAVVSELLGHIARRAPYGGRIDIQIKESTLRQNPAVEVMFRSADEKAQDKETFLKNLSQTTVEACKGVLTKEGGLLSADLPELAHPSFKILLKTTAAADLQPGDHEVFKYDISIKNIANVRKRFGIKKSESLVAQIEEFVKSLVRHPIDIVTAMRDKGIVTAIYETQKGAAQSVAGRISSRLGSEKFRIGKMEVDLAFGYRLSALSSLPYRRSEEAQKPDR